MLSFSNKTKSNNSTSKQFIDYGFKNCISIIEKAFANYQTQAFILAYLSHPEITKDDLNNLITEVRFKYGHDKDSAEIVETAMQNLYELCLDEKLAQNIYLKIIDLYKRNLINIDQLLFKQIVQYAANDELRIKTRKAARK